MHISESGITITKWRFAELEKDLFAMVPWDGLLKDNTEAAQEGDVVAVVDGGKVPIVLRENPLPDNNVGDRSEVNIESVGTAYVHGFIDGLVADWTEKGILKRRDFSIV